MNGTGKCYAKQNKPGSERQIPYDLTFNRNLINETNKQNITKDTEIENRLTVTRGEGEGISGEKGEGFVGTIIKDTWTITWGWWKQEGDVESWGVGLRWGKRQKTT